MEQKWLRHAAKEIRSLKSIEDVRYLNRKLQFLFGRMTGGFVRGTKVPPNLQIEPANSCNLRCTCCSGHRNLRPRGYMDFGLFCRIVDEAAAVGAKRIHLYLHGEPLLHPQIGDMIRRIKSRHLAVTMATNAMLLTPRKIEDIMRSHLTHEDYILLSVLGNSKETHEKVMRGVDHDRVVANIKNLVEYRRVHELNGPIIETVFFRTPDNAHEEEAYRDYWGKVVDNSRATPASEQYVSYRDGHAPTSFRTRTCHQLWERMTVHWNGNVVLCHADIDGQIVLGSLQEMTIPEIWNCDRVSAIRDLHRQSRFRDLPICAACDW